MATDNDDEVVLFQDVGIVESTATVRLNREQRLAN